MPSRMNEFVRAIEDMMYTGHRLIVFANLHKILENECCLIEVGK